MWLNWINLSSLSILKLRLDSVFLMWFRVFCILVRCMAVKKNMLIWRSKHVSVSDKPRALHLHHLNFLYMKKILFTFFVILSFILPLQTTFAITGEYSDYNVNMNDSWLGGTLRTSDPNKTFSKILGIGSWQQLVYATEVV